jgi:hypothetical protein
MEMQTSFKANLKIIRLGGNINLKFISFSGTEVWTQGFMLAKQAFYCLSHTSSLISFIVDKY